MINKTFKSIIKKTGRYPSECNCDSCQNQCRRVSCLGTPEDILAIAKTEYKDHLINTMWAVGVAFGYMKTPIDMVQINSNFNGCSLFKDGKCLLREKRLKPTEDKLSHHTLPIDNYDLKKSISYNVAKEWLNPANKEIIREIYQIINSKEHE